jgi:serine/threonine protein kinase
VKLADFGFSKKAISEHTMTHTGGGTPLYMAPEMQSVIQNGTSKRSRKVTYTEAVDVWAVGVMTFQILARRHPFLPGEIGKYARGELRFPDRRLRRAAVSDEACEFVRSLLAPKPADRPNVKECRQKHWLQTHTTFPRNPTFPSDSVSLVDGPMDELQEASATWASEQISRIEVNKQTSVLGEVAGDNTALPSPVTSKPTRNITPSTLVTHVDEATTRVPGRGFKERDELLDCPKVTEAGSAATKIGPQLQAASFSESPKPSKEADRHLRPKREPRDSQSDGSDNSSEVEGHVHENAHSHDVRRSHTPNSKTEHFASSEKEPGRTESSHHSSHKREHRTATTSPSTSPEPSGKDSDTWSLEALPPTPRVKAYKKLEIPLVTKDAADTKSLRAMRFPSPHKKHGDASVRTPRTHSGRLSPFRHGRHNNFD